MECCYVDLISRGLHDVSRNAHIVTARYELYFLYKSDCCRCYSVEILSVGRQGRGALNRLDTQIVQPLSSKVVVQGQSDSENS